MLSRGLDGDGSHLSRVEGPDIEQVQQNRLPNCRAHAKQRKLDVLPHKNTGDTTDALQPRNDLSLVPSFSCELKLRTPAMKSLI